ncbi:resistance to inhibitors of cholinesterase protein 3-like [Argonauta hians]
MSTIKVIAVFSIIFGCFAMLYPRFLHPIVLRAVGMSATSSENDMLSNMQNPKIVAMNQNRPQRGGDDVRPIRPNAHPGLRAASEMRAQQQQAGSGRGMMGIVLPMYAVGIVLYLIYTLVKVFSKKSETEKKEKDPLKQLRNFKYDDRKGKFTFGEDLDPEEDFRDYLHKKHKQQQLEELISKADDRHITELEMRQLQQRLEETETQMTRILQAMQSVQQHVSGVVDRAAGNTGGAADELVHDKEEQTQDGSRQTEHSNSQDKANSSSNNSSSNNSSNITTNNKVPTSDSTPDLESYEFLRTNSHDSSDYCWLNGTGSATNSPEVETVSSVIDNFARKNKESSSSTPPPPPPFSSSCSSSQGRPEAPTASKPPEKDTQCSSSSSPPSSSSSPSDVQNKEKNCGSKNSVCGENVNDDDDDYDDDVGDGGDGDDEENDGGDEEEEEDDDVCIEDIGPDTDDKVIVRKRKGLPKQDQ